MCLAVGKEAAYYILIPKQVGYAISSETCEFCIWGQGMVGVLVIVLKFMMPLLSVVKICTLV
jgi:hypothetical protein